MPETLKLRFAVGMIDDWRQLEKTAGDMRARGLKLENVSCLGFERVLGGKRLHEQPAARTIPLPFSASPELIACTPGILASGLTERLKSGARSLKDALGHWFIPRHAQQFEDTVHNGEILLWLNVADDDAERSAYKSLLAHSSGSVGVHDLLL